jgi:hypothetical protein
MENEQQDCFKVYIRDTAWPARPPEDIEEDAVTCFSYHEAAQVRQELRVAGRHCIIRCVGQSGVGD